MLMDKIREKLDLSVVKSVDLEDMAIDFTGPDHWSAILSSDHMIARLVNIPGFTWPIQQVQLRVVIQHQGVDIGRLESPYTPASVSRGIVTSVIEQTTMSIFEPARSAYSGFVAALTTQSHHTFAIKGSADIIFNLGFLGTHSITDVDFLSDLTLRGLNNLPEIQCMAVEDVTYSDIDHEGTAQLEQTGQNTGRHQLIISVLFDIPNPSQLSLTLGDLTLGVSYGVKPSPGSKFSSERLAAEEATRSTIGTITLMSLILLQGMNKCRVARITLDTRLEATQQFLKHIAEEPQMVHMQGLQGTSKNEALAGGLASLATSFTMPTFTAPAPQ